MSERKSYAYDGDLGIAESTPERELVDRAVDIQANGVGVAADTELETLPDPALPAIDQTYNIIVTGVSGTGIVTATKGFLTEDVPGGASYWYAFGSATVFAMILQIVTGIFLTLYYSPSASTAWESATNRRCGTARSSIASCASRPRKQRQWSRVWHAKRAFSPEPRPARTSARQSE